MTFLRNNIIKFSENLYVKGYNDCLMYLLRDLNVLVTKHICEHHLRPIVDNGGEAAARIGSWGVDPGNQDLFLMVTADMSK